MKKNLLLIICLTLLVFITGCENKKALEFKKEYESMNGVESKSGKVHRTVSINKNNPYEKVNAKDIVEKINNKETFYVYFGDKLCPWCRSVVEKSIEVAKDKKINKIYYVAIWNDEGEEILRDKYTLENNELKKIVDGTEEYYKLLDKFKDLLSDYTLANENGEKIETGEKRIFAPNYIYVEKGVPKTLISGISEKQTDSREELTTEILEDEEKIFNEFFK